MRPPRPPRPRSAPRLRARARARATWRNPAEEIRSFRGTNEFLSNFYEAPVVMDATWTPAKRWEAIPPETYPTSEHAYQAQKANFLGKSQAEAAALRAQMARASSPGVAKRIGGGKTAAGDAWRMTSSQQAVWNEPTNRVGVMAGVLSRKFQQHPDLAQKLLNTGDAVLVEGNDWGDTFFGVVNSTGEGENWLGELLMLTRKNLALSAPAAAPPPPSASVWTPGKIRLVNDISPELVVADRDTLYVFGDNMEHLGSGPKSGQADYGRAYGKKQSNTVGIVTKRARYTLFTDADAADPKVKQEIDQAFDLLEEHLAGGGDVVWPTADVGTGRAKLESGAPKIWAYIQARKAALGVPSPRSAAPPASAPQPSSAGRVVSGSQPFDVYIGRGPGGSIPMDPAKRGYFGNPIEFGKQCGQCGTVHEDTTQGRQALVDCFERCARYRISQDQTYRDQVEGLYGKTLRCFCAPKLCHGNVLLKLAAELKAGTFQADPTYAKDCWEKKSRRASVAAPPAVLAPSAASAPATPPPATAPASPPPAPAAEVEEPTEIVLGRIISGGQLGADMGGLLAGRQLGLTTGGKAPRDWMQRLGPGNDVSAKAVLQGFGLVEHDKPEDFDRSKYWSRSKAYSERTKANALGSQATLWIGTQDDETAKDGKSAGYKVTSKWATQAKVGGRAGLFEEVLWPFTQDEEAEAARIRRWLIKNRIATLNVAGNEEWKRPGLQEATYKFLSLVLTGAKAASVPRTAPKTVLGSGLTAEIAAEIYPVNPQALQMAVATFSYYWEMRGTGEQEAIDFNHDSANPAAGFPSHGVLDPGLDLAAIVPSPVRDPSSNPQVNWILGVRELLTNFTSHKSAARWMGTVYDENRRPTQVIFLVLGNPEDYDAVDVSLRLEQESRAPLVTSGKALVSSLADALTAAGVVRHAERGWVTTGAVGINAPYTADGSRMWMDELLQFFRDSMAIQWWRESALAPMPQFGEMKLYPLEDWAGDGPSERYLPFARFAFRTKMWEKLVALADSLERAGYAGPRVYLDELKQRDKIPLRQGFHRVPPVERLVEAARRLREGVDEVQFGPAGEIFEEHAWLGDRMYEIEGMIDRADLFTSTALENYVMSFGPKGAKRWFQHTISLNKGRRLVAFEPEGEEPPEGVYEPEAYAGPEKPQIPLEYVEAVVTANLAATAKSYDPVLLTMQSGATVKEYQTAAGLRWEQEEPTTSRPPFIEPPMSTSITAFIVDLGKVKKYLIDRALAEDSVLRTSPEAGERFREARERLRKAKGSGLTLENDPIYAAVRSGQPLGRELKYWLLVGHLGKDEDGRAVLTILQGGWQAQALAQEVVRATPVKTGSTWGFRYEPLPEEGGWVRYPLSQEYIQKTESYKGTPLVTEMVWVRDPKTGRSRQEPKVDETGMPVETQKWKGFRPIVEEKVGSTGTTEEKDTAAYFKVVGKGLERGISATTLKMLGELRGAKVAGAFSYGPVRPAKAFGGGRGYSAGVPEEAAYSGTSNLISFVLRTFKDLSAPVSPEKVSEKVKQRAQWTGSGFVKLPTLGAGGEELEEEQSLKERAEAAKESAFGADPFLGRSDEERVEAAVGILEDEQAFTRFGVEVPGEPSPEEMLAHKEEWLAKLAELEGALSRESTEAYYDLSSEQGMIKDQLYESDDPRDQLRGDYIAKTNRGSRRMRWRERKAAALENPYKGSIKPVVEYTDGLFVRGAGKRRRGEWEPRPEAVQKLAEQGEALDKGGFSPIREAKKPSEWDVGQGTREVFPKRASERSFEDRLTKLYDVDIVSRVAPPRLAVEEADRDLASGTAFPSQVTGGAKALAEQMEITLHDAGRMLRAQKESGKRGYSMSASMALCMPYRVVRLKDYTPPKVVSGYPGPGAKDKVLIWLSPLSGNVRNPDGTVEQRHRPLRVMNFRRGMHIDCDMVAKRPGQDWEVVAKAIMSALMWLGEKGSRKDIASVYLGRIGQPTILKIWSAGNPAISIDQVRSALEMSPDKKGEVGRAQITGYSGQKLADDVKAYDAAVRALPSRAKAQAFAAAASSSGGAEGTPIMEEKASFKEPESEPVEDTEEEVAEPEAESEPELEQAAEPEPDKEAAAAEEKKARPRRPRAGPALSPAEKRGRKAAAGQIVAATPSEEPTEIVPRRRSKKKPGD